MNDRKAILLAFLAVWSTACLKDPPFQPDDPTVPNVTARFEFHWGAGVFDAGTTYADGMGHAVRFDRILARLDAPELIDPAGGVLFSDPVRTCGVSSADTSAMAIGHASTGVLRHMRFTIGKHADGPTGPVVGHVVQQREWPALVLVGSVDTDGDGTLDAPFRVEVPEPATLRSIDLPFFLPIPDQGGLLLHVDVLLQELMSGIDLSGSTPGGSQQEDLLDNFVTCLHTVS
ncbi:MAG: hypothetical protein H6594_12370 [Flavobacteriales bacterium]|nr:hypothetical protein [Flavobacteriales bacterium]